MIFHEEFYSKSMQYYASTPRMLGSQNYPP